MAFWSDIENDVLEHITSYLPLPDQHRFRAVCKSWRDIVKQKWHSPAQQLPWLVLGEERETKKRKFYSLSEDRHYSIDIPELYGRYICGSSFGWLFAVDIKVTSILVNPFTRECIELPPLPPYEYHDQMKEMRLVERLPDGHNTDLHIFPSEHMQLTIVFKVALSHDPRERSDFIVVILFGHVYRPAFWRPGDTSWTMIEAPRVRMEDVIFFKGNCYVADGTNEIFVVEFGPHPKLTAVQPSPGPSERATAQVYLAVLNGVLVLLERFHYLVEKRHLITDKFNILEPEFNENAIYEWEDIDGFALFVGTNSTIVIDASQFAACNRDSIYFTHITSSLSADKFGYDDLGVFDIIGNTVSSYYRYKDFHPQIGAPIWFTPSP